MSILTYKIPHNKDFSNELKIAFDLAEYVLANQTKGLSSKHVKDKFKLPSYTSRHIIKKYNNDKKTKKISSVPFPIPKDAIKYDSSTGIIKVRCLDLTIALPGAIVSKINSILLIEITPSFYHIACEVTDIPLSTVPSTRFLGIDRNAVSHIAVCACPDDGKVIKLGKSANHNHQKQKNIRKNAQKANKLNFVKQQKDKERRRARDLNHKVSRKIVDHAFKNDLTIKLEKLTGISKKIPKRNTKNKKVKNTNYTKSSWSHYELETQIVYKARLLGVRVEWVNPFNTSKICSRCGTVGDRSRKSFKCLNPSCKHVCHADVNAAFNIAKAKSL